MADASPTVYDPSKPLPSPWQVVGNTLTCTYRFTTFVDAMAFVNQVATVAEKQQHHPDIAISYNQLTLTTTTHDAGHTVTAKDVQLVEAIHNLHAAASL
jgi:4a-hydroxytetrahydrobiopterin dehydratase